MFKYLYRTCVNTSSYVVTSRSCDYSFSLCTNYCKTLLVLFGEFLAILEFGNAALISRFPLFHNGSETCFILLLLFRKITLNSFTRCVSLAQNASKMRLRPGLCSRPRWEWDSSQRSPNLQLDLKGLLRSWEGRRKGEEGGEGTGMAGMSVVHLLLPAQLPGTH